MYSTTEKQHIRLHKHPGNAYLVIQTVGVTHTYSKKMKSYPEALLEEFSKNYTIETV